MTNKKLEQLKMLSKEDLHHKQIEFLDEIAGSLTENQDNESTWFDITELDKKVLARGLMAKGLAKPRKEDNRFGVMQIAITREGMDKASVGAA